MKTYRIEFMDGSGTVVRGNRSEITDRGVLNIWMENSYAMRSDQNSFPLVNIKTWKVES